jgi:hypothetical protein
MFNATALLHALLASSLVCGVLFANVNVGEKAPAENCQDERQKDPGLENYLKSLKEARVEQIKLRLDVTEERAKAIADKWSALEDPIRRKHVECMSLWRQMQFIIQEASPEKEKSRKIKPLYDNYIVLRQELGTARQRLYQELPQMLDSPIQQARMLLLMEEMERKERDGLKSKITHRRQMSPKK